MKMNWNDINFVAFLCGYPPKKNVTEKATSDFMDEWAEKQRLRGDIVETGD